MKNYEIEIVIKDDFEDIQKLSSILNRKSEFGQASNIEKIDEWEKNNKIHIPSMYKSWLLLTSYARIMEGYFELYFPEIEDEYSDNVFLGSIIGDGETLYFSKSTGKIYSIYESEKKEFQDFDDFLSYIHIKLEEAAEEEYGDTWLEIYNQEFSDN